MAYTYLRVGTKPFRSKPPRKGPPCTEPYLRGSNILRDPGFELSATQPGWVGPDNEFMNDSGLHFNDYEPVGPRSYPSLPAWSSGENPPANNTYWRVSTASPRSGSYHARYTASSANFIDEAEQLQPVAFVVCPLSTELHVSARVEPGDFVKHSAWIKATTSAGTPKLDAIWGTIDADLVATADETPISGVTLTGTYTQYEFSFIVPASSKYLAYIGFWPYCTATNVDATYDIDDAVLEVR